MRPRLPAQVASRTSKADFTQLLVRAVSAPGVEPYLPFHALDAADGTGGGNLLDYWPGVAVSVAYIVGLGALGVLRTRRRDIT